MQIKSFKLFAQLKNFYHDRYYIEAGSHPAGINIRWGLNWEFQG